MNPGTDFYRHRIHIESPVQTQDSVTGEVTVTWSRFIEDVPCAIQPLSARDFIQAQSVQSEVSVRIVFRWLDNLTDTMRFVGACGCHLGKIYNPEGLLEDPESARVYITAPCKEGVNSGDL